MKVFGRVLGTTNLDVDLDDATMKAMESIKRRTGSDDEAVMNLALANMLVLLERYEQDHDAELIVKDQDGNITKRAKIIDLIRNPRLLSEDSIDPG